MVEHVEANVRIAHFQKRDLLQGCRSLCVKQLGNSWALHDCVVEVDTQGPGLAICERQRGFGLSQLGSFLPLDGSVSGSTHAHTSHVDVIRS